MITDKIFFAYKIKINVCSSTKKYFDIDVVMHVIHKLNNDSSSLPYEAVHCHRNISLFVASLQWVCPVSFGPEKRCHIVYEWYRV